MQMLSFDLQDFRGIYWNRYKYFETTRYLQNVNLDRPHTRNTLTLREKCPNIEFFLVRIFPYLD